MHANINLCSTSSGGLPPLWGFSHHLPDKGTRRPWTAVPAAIAAQHWRCAIGRVWLRSLSSVFFVSCPASCALACARGETWTLVSSEQVLGLRARVHIHKHTHDTHMRRRGATPSNSRRARRWGHRPGHRDLPRGQALSSRSSAAALSRYSTGQPHPWTSTDSILKAASASSRCLCFPLVLSLGILFCWCAPVASVCRL